MFNRRTTVRVHPRADEPIEGQISGDHFIDECDVRDISAGGIGVAAPHLVSASTVGLNGHIEMVIKLPRQKPLVAQGVIRHLTAQGILGIEFTKISPADRARVQLYVENRMADGGAAI